MKINQTILIITYYWPPSGGVGVQRWMNFAIQLKKRGWNPIVLTPQNPYFAIRDEELAEKVKKIPIYKIPIWEPFDLFHKLTGNRDRKNVQQGLVLEKKNKSLKTKLVVWIRGNLFIPDPRIFWLKVASKKALEIIKKENIGTIVTTGPPHSMHLIGRKIKRKCDVKWLADFRDPWSKWDLLTKLNTSAIVLGIHRRMEKSILKEATSCTATSKRMAEEFGNIEELNNGVSLHPLKDIKPNDSHFTIGYFGLLNEIRNPRQLWLLLEQMCKENQFFANKLKLRIGGIISETIKKEISNLPALSKKTEFLGYLPHSTIQKEYSLCNILLILQNKSTNSKYILPVKFFEYLAADRMMLCFGEKESDLGDLMNEKDIGKILDYHEIDEIKTFLIDIFENKKKPNPKDIATLFKQFSHTNLVKKLEKILLKD